MKNTHHLPLPLCLLIFVILHSSLGLLHSQVPQLVSYQGRVAVGTVNFEGAGQFRFALVDTAGTTVYWGNAADTTPADGVPDAAVSLAVSKGLYSVLLGDTSIANMAAIPASVWTNADVRLRVWFNDGVNGNQLLTPDQRLAPNGYLPDGSVSAAKLATSAVDSPQLAGSAVTAAKIANNAVTTAKLNNGAVTSSKLSIDAVQEANIASGAVTAAKLASDIGLWSASGANVFRSTGNVGIGTDNPIAKLDVNGGINFSGIISGNGSALTNLNGASLTAGSVGGTQLGSNLTLGGTTSGTFSGDGAALTSLNASNISSGTLADARLSSNVPLLGISNTFTSTQTFAAGTTTLAPLKLQTGVHLTSPQFGAVEFDGTNLYLTNNSGSPTRKTLAFTDSVISPSQIAAGSITSTMLADGSVGTAKLAAGAMASSVNVSGATQATLANTSYVATGASQTSFILPTTANVGDTTQLSATGAGGWSIGWTARASNRQWRSVASSADGSKLVAVVFEGQIYTSADSGVSWTARAFNSSWLAVASSGDGSKLVAVVPNGQIYTSADSGVSWTVRESARVWTSVASSADGSKLVAVAQNGRIYTSTDSGVSWTARESVRNWQSVASSADGSKLVAVASFGQIYTSTDSGMTWAARETSRQWSSVASSADGSKLVALAFGGQIYTSADSGVSWTARAINNPWRSVASSADGSKLVAVVDGGQIYTSSDSGVSWTARESSRNWWSVASSADGSKLAATATGGQIYTSSNAGLDHSGAKGTTATLSYSGAGWIPVAESQIATGAVGSAQLADSSVTSVKVADGSIMDADISAAATIADTKLGTISSAGKVANSATTATEANFGSSIVLRDATGNFSASTITATFSGDGAALTSLNASNISSGTLADARLSSNVPLLDISNTFSSTQTLAVGTTSLAPLKLQTGVNLTTPQFGAVEFDGTNLFLTTDSGSPTRKTLAFTDSVISPAQIAAGSITSTMLADGAVSTAKIAAGAVTNTQLGANAVQSANIATGAVTNAQMAVGAITGANLATQSRSGTMLDGVLSFSTPGSVTSAILFSPALNAAPTLSQIPGGWTFSAVGPSGFTASAPFAPQVIDSTGDVGRSTTVLQTASGRPAISYYDVTAGTVKFAIAANPDGSGGWTTTTVDSANTGFPFSMAILGGVPCIAYRKIPGDDLAFARASSADGTGPWTITLADNSAAATGNYASLAEVAGRPAVSYRSPGAQILKYAIAPDATGTGAWTVVTVDGTGNAGNYTSLAVVDGNPAISYQDVTNGDLKFVRATDASGTTWGTPITLESTGTTGLYTSLRVINGNPAISYYDSTNGDLKYIRATDASGTTWGAAVTLDSTGSVGLYTSMSIINGRPAVSYFDDSGDNLKLAYASTTDGSGPWTTVAVDSTGSIGQHTSLAVVNGGVAISYYDATNQDLKYAAIPALNWAASEFGTAGPIAATSFSGNGAALTNLNGTNLTAGTVGSAQLAAGATAPPVSIAGTTQAAAANASYLATSASPTTINLPATANVGDVVQVTGAGAGGWSASYIDPSHSSWTARESNRHWAGVASSTDGSKLVAVAPGHPIYTSTDSGVSWTARESNRDWFCVASSADGSKLVAGIFNGQIYTSTDSGVSWTARESNRSWHSVASSAGGSKLVAVGRTEQIYTSTDSGVSWTARESNRDWVSVASSADGSKLVAVAYGGQIYTSTDSGVSWTARESARNWYSVASSADGSKLVAAVFGEQIYTSTDSGVSWTARESARSWTSVASSADGSKLVAVEWSGQIYISTDSGVSWTARESNRVWYSVASSADGSKLVAVLDGGQIYTSEASVFVASGAQGSHARMQYLGSGQWAPVAESQIAAGAVTADKLGADVGLWSVSGADVFRPSGNVGIGTSAPTSKLEVLTDTDSFGFIHTDGTAAFGSYMQGGASLVGTFTDSPLILLTNSGDGTSVSLSQDRFSVTAAANENLVIRPGSQLGNADGIGIQSVDVTHTTHLPLTLFASETAILGGNVGVGTATPDAALHVVTQSAGSGNNTAAFSAPSIGANQSHIHYGTTGDWIIRSASSSGKVVIQDSGGGVGIGRTPVTNKLEVEGNASKTTATAWLANSDRRIKQDIQPIGNALDTLDRVRLVDFRYTDGYRAQHPSIEDRRYLNVIAQEFAGVFPDYVKPSGEKLEDGSAILQVDTYPLTIYSAAAVQELSQKLKAKDAEIAALKRQLEAQAARDKAIEARLAALEQGTPKAVKVAVKK